jgi:hypothetical protein
MKVAAAIASGTCCTVEIGSHFLELHLYAFINLLKADNLIHSAVGYVFVAVLFFEAFVAIFRNFFLACSEHQENKSGHVAYILLSYCELRKIHYFDQHRKVFLTTKL